MDAATQRCTSSLGTFLPLSTHVPLNSSARVLRCSQPAGMAAIASVGPLSASLLAGIALGALAALTAMAALFRSAAAVTFSYP